MSAGSGSAEPGFAPAGKGLWELESIHFSRPVTTFVQELYAAGFVKGFAEGAARFGLLLDHLKPGYSRSFMYVQPVAFGAPEGAMGPPPKPVLQLLTRLHPATRKRIARSAKAIEIKLWREDLKRWDEVDKPAAIVKHRAIQAVDVERLSDDDLAQHVLVCAEHAGDSAYLHHKYTIAAILPVGDFLAGAPPGPAAAAANSSACSAGAHLTLLGLVGGDAVVEAVREVRASVVGPAALAYRDRFAVDGAIRMGVVVQEMVDADVAGVLFTRDPLTGADELVIEASWGLGEAVVAGLVTPDHVRMDLEGSVLEHIVGDKDLGVRLSDVQMPLALIGAGLGLSSPAAQSASLSAAASSQSGMAAGVASTMRYLGAVAGIAVLGRVLDLDGSRARVLAEHRACWPSSRWHWSQASPAPCTSHAGTQCKSPARLDEGRNRVPRDGDEVGWRSAPEQTRRARPAPRGEGVEADEDGPMTRQAAGPATRAGPAS
jgi:hypothetical protein